MRKMMAAAAAVVVLAAGCSGQAGNKASSNGEPIARPSAASMYFPALVDVRVDMKNQYKDMNWEDRVSPAGAVAGCVDVVGQAYGTELPDGPDTKAKVKQIIDGAIAKHGFGATEVKSEEGKSTRWEAKDGHGSVAVFNFGGTNISGDIYYPAKQGECMK